MKAIKAGTQRPASWFTHAPKGFSHAEAATLTTAGVTAWRALVGDGLLKPGDTMLALATGLRSVVDRTFPLEGPADASRYQESGQHVGKICVEF